MRVTTRNRPHPSTDAVRIGPSFPEETKETFGMSLAAPWRNA